MTTSVLGEVLMVQCVIIVRLLLGSVYHLTLYLATLRHGNDELSLNVDGLNNPMGFDKRTVGKIPQDGGSDKLYIGKGRDQYNNKYKGDMGEILIYNRSLTEKETNLIQKILKRKWSFKDYPTLTSIQPNMGLSEGGNEIRISGSNFSDFGNRVTIGGVNCPIISEDQKEIICKVPENPKGTKNVSTFNVVVKKSEGEPIEFLNGFTYIGQSKLWLDASDIGSIR